MARLYGGGSLADAKELLQESITRLEELVQRGREASDNEELGAALDRLSSLAAELKPVLGKVYLKTRQGLSAVVPIHDRVDEIDETLGGAIDHGDPICALADIQDALDDLESNVISLRAAVASRDVVMT